MMKRIFFLLLISLTFFGCGQSKSQTKNPDVSTYYLIRHAEKDRTDKSNSNPNLKEEGKERAQNWAKYFNNVNFDAVYSTDYNRTKETATPTAEKNNLELKFYNPSKIDAPQFLADTKGQTVLIVGHSNTTPVFANALLGENKYEMIADDNNSNLYVVTVNKDKKTAELKVVD